MATVLTDHDPQNAEQNNDRLPDASDLEDKLPESLRASRVLAGFATILGAGFLYLSCCRLWHTDLWGHLAYGRHMWNAGGLPSTEPLMPLSQGVAFLDTAWLSQLIGFGAFEMYGTEGIQFLYAVTITLAATLLVWRCYQRTGNAVVTIGGLLLFALVNRFQLQIVRPQLAGLDCFVILLVLLTARSWSTVNWVAVPLLFAAWANLHGSFPVGLGLLACFAVGRAIDIVRRTRKVAAPLYDRQTIRLLLLTQLAAAACLLNPYGIELYANVLSFGAHENLADLVEWQPLNLHMSQAQAMLVATIVLIFAYRLSPRRVSATEVLLLVGLGVSAMWTSRMILWWAPVAAYYVAIHCGAIWNHWRGTAATAEPAPRSGKWSVVTLGVIWIAFGYTPLASQILHGRDREFDKSVSEYTPIGAVEYLRKNPPQGLVFNTYEFGDYLLWNGPDNVQVFTASHAHLIPAQVWRDYMDVITLGSGWEDTLDEYGANTVILDQRYRKRLISRMKRNDAWRLGFEDVRAAVFIRNDPI